MDKLTHFNAQGEAHMVDVAAKSVTHRTAIAAGEIDVSPDTLERIKSGQIKKGDVLSVARLAAIMATKRTSDLIPLCHPLPLTHVNVEFELTDSGVYCECRCECDGKTGVEMEALTGVQIALLTIFDMCKAMDKGMVIKQVRLLEKTGGKSGHFKAQ